MDDRHTGPVRDATLVVSIPPQIDDVAAVWVVSKLLATLGIDVTEWHHERMTSGD